MRVAMGVTPSAIATALLLVFHPLLLPTNRRMMISAYRIKGSDDEGRPFVPYERGFVQNVQDPDPRIRMISICNAWSRHEEYISNFG